MVRVVACCGPFASKSRWNGKLKYYRTPLVFVGVGERELQLPSLGKRVKGGKRGAARFRRAGR